MMSFHRPGSYAVNFGLDTDNVLKVGGWSMGSGKYPIVLSGAGGTYSLSVSGSAASISSNGGLQNMTAWTIGSLTISNGFTYIPGYPTISVNSTLSGSYITQVNGYHCISSCCYGGVTGTLPGSWRFLGGNLWVRYT
jgi:hypothetical protein